MAGVDDDEQSSQRGCRRSAKQRRLFDNQLDGVAVPARVITPQRMLSQRDADGGYAVLQLIPANRTDIAAVGTVADEVGSAIGSKDAHAQRRTVRRFVDAVGY